MPRRPSRSSPPTRTSPSAILTPWSSAIDAVGDALDDVHVVLDDEDRVAALAPQPADQLGDLVGLDRIHSGRRLVEEQQLRLRRGRPGDLEPPPVCVRERVGGLVPAIPHQPLAEEAQALGGELLDLLLLAPHPRRAHHRAQDPGVRVPVRGRHHVLHDGHVEEQPQGLERARDPALRDLVRLEAEQRLCLEQDLARVRPEDAGDKIEERRLPRPVRADHADDLALIDVEVEPGDDRQSPPNDLSTPRSSSRTSAIRRPPPASSRTTPRAAWP